MEEEVKKEEQKAPVKLTYEQLESVAHQLQSQNQQLFQQINAIRIENMFKRLEFLFKVVEDSDRFPSDFVIKCTDEIVDMMTLKEEEPKEDEKAE